MVFHSEYEDVPALETPIHETVLGGAAAFGDGHVKWLGQNSVQPATDIRYTRH